MRTIFLNLLIIFLVASFAGAHGIGQSFEKTIDDYVIDVGVEAFEIVAGEPLQFDFVLRDKDEAGTAEFTNVWVRMTAPDKSVAFAGNIHRPEFGPTIMTYIFPESGDYELSLSFENADEVIVESGFSLKVDDSESGSSAFSGDIIVGMLVGLVAAGSIGWFLRKKQ